MVLVAVVSCTDGSSCVLSRRRGDRLLAARVGLAVAVAVAVARPVGREQANRQAGQSGTV